MTNPSSKPTVPIQSTATTRMVRMTPEQFKQGLRDLEHLARIGGLGDDNISDIYADRLEEYSE